MADGKKTLARFILQDTRHNYNVLLHAAQLLQFSYFRLIVGHKMNAQIGFQCKHMERRLSYRVTVPLYGTITQPHGGGGWPVSRATYMFLCMLCV